MVSDSSEHGHCDDVRFRFFLKANLEAESGDFVDLTAADFPGLKSGMLVHITTQRDAQGWPWTFRTGIYGFPQFSRWDYNALFANVALSLAILGAVAFMLEYLIRRRRPQPVPEG